MKNKGLFLYTTEILQLFVIQQYLTDTTDMPTVYFSNGTMSVADMQLS